MKKKPLRLTISFSKDHEDVYHYLNSQENISKFICEIVKIEMKDGKKADDFESKVYKSLLKIIENENLTFIPTVPSSESSSSLMDNEIDLLSDLFG